MKELSRLKKHLQEMEAKNDLGGMVQCLEDIIMEAESQNDWESAKVHASRLAETALKYVNDETRMRCHLSFAVTTLAEAAAETAFNIRSRELALEVAQSGLEQLREAGCGATETAELRYQMVTLLLQLERHSEASKILKELLAEADRSPDSVAYDKGFILRHLVDAARALKDPNLAGYEARLTETVKDFEQAMRFLESHQSVVRSDRLLRAALISIPLLFLAGLLYLSWTK